MSEFAVTAIGRDRPGIVAAISGALLRLRGNIEDSQMSILRGHFAVMLIVRVPGELDEGSLQKSLEDVRNDLDLEAVAVSRVDDLRDGSARPSHVLTVYGADHPGIVHAVAAALAEHGVNITGLQTRLADSGNEPLYVMTMEVAIEEASESAVGKALSEVADEAKVEVSMRPLAAEPL
jgi:glycine cleavage system transcriptional repressor